MKVLRDMPQADEPRDASERLERFLGTIDGHKFGPEELRPKILRDIVLSTLAQHKAYRISRT
jgi:hypothetical protein